jgi:hypothetical protein
MQHLEFPIFKRVHMNSTGIFGSLNLVFALSEYYKKKDVDPFFKFAAKTMLGYAIKHSVSESSHCAFSLTLPPALETCLHIILPSSRNFATRNRITESVGAVLELKCLR